MSERFPKHDYAEDEDTHLRDIKSKISSLKAVYLFYFSDILCFKISIDIGNEVREHNSLLDKMVISLENGYFYC